MHSWWKTLLAAFIVFACILAITAIIYQIANPRASVTASGPLTGNVGDTLKLSNGLSITLIRVERQDGQLLFRFAVHNNGQQDVQILKEGTVPQFYVSPPRGYFVQAGSAKQAERIMYPPIPSTLSANASADGWVSIDTATTGELYPQIMYAFAVVSDSSCANPQDQSTCRSDEAYKALIWNFQIPK